MIACEWSDQVALLAGGDLDGVERLAVEQHLSECMECRQLFGELQDDRALLAAEPEIPAAVYEGVRAAVLRRARPSRWWMPVAVAAGLVLMAAMSWYGFRMRQPLERIEVAIVTPPAPAVARSVPIVRKNVVRAVAPLRHRSAEIAMALRELMPEDNAAPVKAEGPVVITAQTEDPNVIIILVPETRGEDYE